MDPTGSHPASLGHLSDAVAGSRIPLGVIDLTDRRVLVMNDAAAELFEQTAPQLVGRAEPSLWPDAYTSRAEEALAALAHGAIDSYRCRRRIERPSGPLDVWLWARTVTFQDGAVAVVVVAPVGESDATGRLLGTYFGPDAIEIAVGTVDRRSRQLTEIRPNDQVVIGLPTDAVAGTDLTSLVHPDDVERLLTILDPSSDLTEETAVNVRLRREGGWTEVQCVALPTPAEEPLRVVFAPVAPSLAELPGTGRLADLERQILRIAAELHTVADTRLDAGATEDRRPSLDALQPQQREIVDRLLRGERVPTIAEDMFLSPSTVRNHLSKVFKTFEVHSQASLLALLRSDVASDADEEVL